MGEDDYDQLVSLGVELAEREQFSEAIEVLRQAIGLDEEGVAAHYNLAVLYGLLAMGDLRVEDYFEDHVDEQILLQNAIEEYQRVLEIDPAHLSSHNNLATIFALHGEADLAIQELECSLGLDPEQPEAREQLAELRGE